MTKTDAGSDRPATRRAAQRRAAQGGGELGVLLDEGALHLLEQSQLLFREWHRVLHVLEAVLTTWST